MSEHYAGNVDVSAQVREAKEFCATLRELAVRVWICVFVIGAVFLFVYGQADAGGDKFLPSTKQGKIKPVVSYGDVYLEYDERVSFAKRIVQTINSLGYYDKDEMLSSIEQYFTPKVLKDYILSQYNRGFFSQMMNYGVAYVGKVTPGHEFNGEMVPVVYSQDVCYDESIKGDSLKAGVDCRYTKAVNRQSETYLFNVERLVVIKGEPKQVQKFKVRLVLTRVDGALYDKGYLVSEYTEI